MTTGPPPLVEPTPNGLFCAAGGFYIDPWRPVDRAIITHAHSDHATEGCGHYLTSADGESLLRMRVGERGEFAALSYGETQRIGSVLVSLHPAGHIRGAAQVRLESGGAVTVVSGDWKRQADPTCGDFEPLRCHTFLTESTFALPIFRWPAADAVIADIEGWWRGNQAAGKASVLYAYALGKSQRILASLDASIGPLFTHGAVEKVNAVYRAGGVELPETELAIQAPRSTDWSQALIVAPPSAQGSSWLRRFGRISTAMASGWMRVRGIRRRRSMDRGFILSDHADWPELLATIAETGAEQVLATHGYAGVLARHLSEQGLAADVVETRFRGELFDDDESPSEDES